MNGRSRKYAVACSGFFLGAIGAVVLLELAHLTCSAQDLPSEIRADSGHCSVMQGTSDNQTFVCQVWAGKPELFSAPAQLEVYGLGGKLATIEPGGTILEWHFWKDGRQLALHARAENGTGVYALYDTATAVRVAEVPDSLARSRLPQWANDQEQIADESVPESAEFTQQRNMWLAKVLRQLDAIHPGMKRRELDPVLSTEGGLSFRFARTYVSRECSFIKIDVRFKTDDGATDPLHEEGGDIIESVSKPYLGWEIKD